MTAVADIKLMASRWMRFEKAMEILLTVLIVAAPVTVTGFLVWASDRGFDISDEGYYLLSASHPLDIRAASTVAYIYLGLLFRFVMASIVGFRILGYGLMIAAAIFMWSGLYRLCVTHRLIPEQERSYKLIGLAFVVVGTLTYYVMFLPTPSYNLLDVVLVNIFSGLVFYALANGASKPGESKTGWFLVGILLGICFFVKFTSALALFLLAIVTLAVWKRMSIKDYLIGMRSLVAGAASWAIIHFLFIQKFPEWYLISRRGLAFAHLLDDRYSLGSELTRTFHDTYTLVQATLSTFWIAYVATLASLAVFFLMRKYLELSFNWILLSLLLGAGLLSAKCFGSGLYLGGAAHFSGVTSIYLGWLFFLAIITPIFVYAIRQQRDGIEKFDGYRFCLVAIFLFSLPFAGAVGTNNLLYANMAFFLGPWFALFWLCIAPVTRFWHFALPGQLVILILSIVASLMVMTGGIRNPYRLNAGLMAQSQVTRIGNSELLLDKDSGTFFKNLEVAAGKCGLTKADNILAFYNLPGVVFALDGRSPGIPWYNGGYAGSIPALELALSWVPIEQLRTSFVLVEHGVTLPDLGRIGLKFPDAYTRCSEIANPYSHGQPLVLWKPELRRADSLSGGS